MNGRRAVLGLLVCCALLASAFAAASASAASNGTTLFTCKETGEGGGFTKSHCKPGDAGSGKFSHVAVPENTTTDISITNAETANNTTESTKAVLKTELGGVEVLITSIPQLQATGTVQNKKDPVTGEHYFEGEIFITLSEVTDIAPFHCEVYEDPASGETGAWGVIRLSAKLSSKGQGDSVKFTPASGTEFGHYELANCKGEQPGPNGTYKLVGSFACKPDGATINCDHAEVTKQKTLRLQSAIGPILGFAASMALRGRPKGEEGKYTPLSPTTVAT
ncbi:MAG TPA: hypothetical protein VF081_10890 [Solirubrobacterales bacterium]